MIPELVSLLVPLIIVGVVLYLVETYIPMAEGFKVTIRVLVILVLCLFLLRFFGLYQGRMSP
jgi:hypothetical protein